MTKRTYEIDANDIELAEDFEEVVKDSVNIGEPI